MLELADTMIGLQLPILLVAPQDKGYSFKDEKTKMIDKSEIPQTTAPRPQRSVAKKKNTEALFMGLGDIIFPGMLVLSAVQGLIRTIRLLLLCLPLSAPCLAIWHL